MQAANRERVDAGPVGERLPRDPEDAIREVDLAVADQAEPLAHAVGVSVHEVAHLARRQGVVLSLGRAREAEVAIADVEIDRRLVRVREDLGEATLRDAAEELELEGAVAGDEPALGPHRVADGGRVDVRATVFIADDVHGSAQVGDGDALVHREIFAHADRARRLDRRGRVSAGGAGGRVGAVRGAPDQTERGERRDREEPSKQGGTHILFYSGDGAASPKIRLFRRLMRSLGPCRSAGPKKPRSMP